MGHRPWTPEEDEQLRLLLAAGKSHREAAEILNRPINGLGARATRIAATGSGASKRLWTDDESRDAAVLTWPEFQVKYPDRGYTAYHKGRQRFREQLRTKAPLVDYRAAVRKVEGDALIAACVHVPQTDPEIWAKLLATGERHQLPTLILAGDIVTGDMFSKWEVKEAYEFDDELESLRLHLASALQVFDRIVITPGNHVSNRIVKISGGHIRLRHMIDMAGLADAQRERIDTTDIDFIDLRSGAERFLVGHAANYSKIDGRVPVWYAEIQECHVIVGNGHRMGMQVSRSGRWHGYEVGTCANPAYMGYAQDRLTNFPRMLQGFATVRNGAVRLYGRSTPFTDWATELS